MYFFHPDRYISLKGGERHYCNNGGNLALTWEHHALGPESRPVRHPSRLTITFCYRAFNRASPSYRFLNSTLYSVRRGNSIDTRQPLSLTMLHELLHVVIGTDLSPDEIEDKTTGVKKTACKLPMLQWSPYQTNESSDGPMIVQDYAKRPEGYDLTNLPDAYVFFAFAFWLSTTRTNDTKRHWDWSTGRSEH